MISKEYELYFVEAAFDSRWKILLWITLSSIILMFLSTIVGIIV